MTNPENMALFFGSLFIIWTLVYSVYNLIQSHREKKEQEKLGKIFDRYSK